MKNVHLILRHTLIVLITISIIFSCNFVSLLTYADDGDEVTEIYTIADLYAINENMSGNYKLMNDLDLSEATADGGAYCFNGGGWDPIGYNHTSNLTEFTGSFDGCGYTISGLKIRATNGTDAGLFGSIGATGHIENLTIQGSCTDEVAGMIAGTNNGLIEKCVNQGEVTGQKYAGGFVGQNNGTVLDCINEGYISGKEFGGGITGYNKNKSVIKGCSNTGKVYAWMYYTADVIVEYADYWGYTRDAGEITKTAYGGGITGFNAGTISECFNSGIINTHAYNQPYINLEYISEASQVATKTYTFIENLYAIAYGGGISGYNDGHINNGYNNGKVLNKTWIAPRFKYTVKNEGVLTNAKKTHSGEYKGSSYAGGIAGVSNNSIRTCYNRGDIEYTHTISTPESTSDLVTSNEGYEYGVAYLYGGTCVDSYSNIGKNCDGSSILTDDGMKLESSYADWDFDNTWTLNTNYVYPYPQLKSNPQTTLKTIDSVSLLNTPKKIQYFEGDTLDVSGGRIKVYYTDGTSEAISITEDMVSGFDSSTTGIETLTVTYRGNALEYQVEIKEEPEIISVKKISGPNNTVFVKGTSLDYSGWTVQVNYVDETSKTINVTADMTTGVDINTTGKYTAEYSYGEYTFTEDITVIPVQISGIRIKKAPKKTTYILGEEISLDGLKVEYQYNDGTTKVSKDYNLGSYETDKIGTQKVTVSCSNGESTFTDSFDLVIEEGTAVKLNITNQPTKKQYVQGEEFNPAGMTVEAEYSNGVVLPVTTYECSKITSALGTQNIIISYQDVCAEVPVTVIEKSIQNVVLSHLPNKTQYTQNQEVDKTGLVITAVYNDGSKEAVEDYTLSGFNTNTLGTHTVSATYKGYSVSFTINVVEAVSTSIFAETGNVKTTYLQGEQLDLSGLVVKAKYDNGKEKIIEDYETSGFAGTLGLNLVKITYDGLECTVPVFVHVASGDWITVDAPSCTTKGERVQYCSVCGEIAISEEIKELGHDFEDWEIIEDSTCTQDGYKTRKCKVCEYVETQGVDKKEHNWESDYTIDKEATCVLDGSKSIHCKDCSAVKDSTVIRASGHDYTDWDETKSATCLEDGSAERECNTCHIKETMVLNATGHKWSNSYTIDNEPTCTEKGNKSIHCTVCDAVKENSSVEIDKLAHTYASFVVNPTCSQKGYTIHVCKCGDSYKDSETAAKGHDYGNWTEVKTPSCTDEGTEKRECKDCGYTETRGLSKTEHNWESKYTIDQDTTCTTDGSKSIHCKDCSAVKDSTVIKASGHKYSEWNETVVTTCTQDGEAERTCEVCEAKETITLSAFGHSWKEELTCDVEPTCTAYGLASIHCLRCDSQKPGSLQNIEKINHVWDDGEVTTKPTCTEKGVKTYKCTSAGCTETKTEEIAALSHAPEEHASVEETCTTDGNSEYYYCTNCKKYYSDEACTKEIIEDSWVIESHHFWNDGEITKAATATEDGEKTYTCTKCQATKTEVIEKTGGGSSGGDTGGSTGGDTGGGSSGGGGGAGGGGAAETSKTIANATLAKTNYAYTGKAIKPDVTVVDSEGNTLKAGTDYTVTYTNNTNPGEATVTVTGTGDYNGSKITLTFTIVKENTITAATLKKDVYEYTGKAIVPAITVTDQDGKTLKKNTDYAVTLKNNKNVGTATVVVSGKGDYEGSVELAFTINPKSVKLASVKAGKKAVTVKWKKPGKAYLKQTSGYEIVYDMSKAFANAETVKAGRTNVSKTIRKLQSKKNYYFKIRTYKTVGLTKYYSAWSAAKRAKVK